MKNIRIVGVPEHFNLPWHLAIEEGKFEKEGIQLEWTDVPEGTGKMCQMLRDGETDIAVILTEGIVKDIVNGNPSSIVQLYVESPLLWGIHVAAESPYHDITSIAHTTTAISRMGSGSHLMAYVHAQEQAWDTSQLKFHIVNTLDGAVESLQQGTSDYFMWERFMTQPLVDKGIFRRIGVCPTPWPCFVIAVRNELLAADKPLLSQLLQVINKETIHFKQRQNIVQILADRYHQKIEDLQLWLEGTTWSQSGLTETMLNKIQNQLLELNIIDKKGNFATIVTEV